MGEKIGGHDGKAHYIVATAIIVKDGKFLIAKRAAHEKAFPNRWTVPGGKLNTSEYTNRNPDAKELWYNVVEDLVTREVKEEAGLEIFEWDYVTSLTYVRPDNYPCIIISIFSLVVLGGTRKRNNYTGNTPCGDFKNRTGSGAGNYYFSDALSAS